MMIYKIHFLVNKDVLFYVILKHQLFILTITHDHILQKYMIVCDM